MRLNGDQRSPGGGLALGVVDRGDARRHVVAVVHDDGLARHRHDRAALLLLAVVGDDDVAQARRELLREPVDLRR